MNNGVNDTNNINGQNNGVSAVPVVPQQVPAVQPVVQPLNAATGATVVPQPVTTATVATQQVVVHQHIQTGIVGDHVMPTVEVEQNIDQELSIVTMMTVSVDMIMIQNHVMQDHVDHHLIHVAGNVEMPKTHTQ